MPEQHRLARSLLRYKDHPVTRSAARRGDAQDRAVAAEAASCAEAALAEVRRGAGIEPPVVFARTVDRAVHEVRAIAAQYWTPEVAACSGPRCGSSGRCSSSTWSRRRRSR